MDSGTYRRVPEGETYTGEGQVYYLWSDGTFRGYPEEKDEPISTFRGVPPDCYTQADLSQVAERMRQRCIEVCKNELKLIGELIEIRNSEHLDGREWEAEVICTAIQNLEVEG